MPGWPGYDVRLLHQGPSGRGQGPGV